MYIKFTIHSHLFISIKISIWNRKDIYVNEYVNILQVSFKVLEKAII